MWRSSCARTPHPARSPRAGRPTTSRAGTRALLLPPRPPQPRSRPTLGFQARWHRRCGRSLRASGPPTPCARTSPRSCRRAARGGPHAPARRVQRSNSRWRRDRSTARSERCSTRRGSHGVRPHEPRPRTARREVPALSRSSRARLRVPTALQRVARRRAQPARRSFTPAASPPQPARDPRAPRRAARRRPRAGPRRTSARP